MTKTPITATWNDLRGKPSATFRKKLHDIYVSSKLVLDPYANEKAYLAFIGNEIDLNADTGRFYCDVHSEHKYLTGLVEFMSGPGTMCRDLHIDYPEANIVGVEYSQKMIDLGKRIHPKLNLVQGDVSNWVAPFSVDVAFTSGSSVGLLTASQLFSHLNCVKQMLAANSSYYIDVGGYAGKDGGCSDDYGIETIEDVYSGISYRCVTVNVKQNPITDQYAKVDFFWRKQKEWNSYILDFCSSNILRQINYSEIAQYASILGLKVRLWLCSEEEDSYAYHLIDDSAASGFEEVWSDYKGWDDYLVIEIYTGNAARIDDYNSGKLI